VIGDPKSGKSTLAAELAEHGYNLYWISTDFGHKVIGKLSPEARARCDVIVLPDTREYPIAMDTTRALFTTPGPHRICEQHGKVGCTVCTSQGVVFTTWNFATLGEKDIVVLDHLSGVGDSCFNLVTKGKPVDYKPQLDDWGSLKFNMAHIMLAIQNAPFNVLALAHCTEALLEDGKKKLVPQVGSDATSRTVAKYFDHVVHCEVSNASHKFGSMTSYKASVITGSRTDVSIEGMQLPSLEAFFDGTVAEALKKEQAEAAKKKLSSAVASAGTAGAVGAFDLSSLLKRNT
jgi:hypothetical protein